MGDYDLTWGMPVVGYLFLAGLGAGALITSASMLLRGGPAGLYFNVARYGAFIAVPAVGIGVALLIFELGSFEAGHWFRWINLYKVINLSPMSIGTWLLTFFGGVAFLYAYTFVAKGAAPGDELDKLRRMLAWVSLPLGVGVAVYTGVLLGAMPARPLWNSPILAFLFLISSISTGIAALMLTKTFIKRNIGEEGKEEINECCYILSSTDTLFIGLELLMIFLFIMYAHLTIGSVSNAIGVIEFGGSMAMSFWLWVVLVGLIVPALIELYLIIPRLLYKKAFVTNDSLDVIVPITVLIGGFMLRYVIVIAGQITYPVGL